MNSLQELNDFGIQTVEVDDLRPATVIFDVDTRYVNLDIVTTYTSRIVNFNSSINVEEIRNYATANLVFSVEIVYTGSSGGTIDFGTLPTGITLSQVGSVYTLTGFKTSVEWLDIEPFIWTMPTDYTSRRLMFLKLKFTYFDEAANANQIVDWFYYDEDYFYVASLTSAFILPNVEYTRIFPLSVTMTGAFSPTFEIRRLVSFDVAMTSLASLNATSIVGVTVSVTGTLTALATLTGDTKVGSLVSMTSRFTTTPNVNRIFNISVTPMTSRMVMSAPTLSRVIDFTSSMTSRFNQTATTGFRYYLQASMTSAATMTSSIGVITPLNSTMISKFVYVTNPEVTMLIRVDDFDTTRNPAATAFTFMSVDGDDVTVNWGDGNIEYVGNTANQLVNLSHLYADINGISGDYSEYTITVTSRSSLYIIPKSSTRTGVRTIIKWDGLNGFGVGSNLVRNQLVSDLLISVPNYLAPTLTSVTFTSSQFFNSANVSSWDTRQLTDMSLMFSDCITFNQPLNSWNTANVTNMSSMFNNAPAFNQPLNSWNTANVTDMSSMFAGTTIFNQNISSWDVSKVTNMYFMFIGSNAFNQPLNSWNTANVTDMTGMFYNAKAFNQPLNSWNTAKVTIMDFMFNGASVFDQNISSWDVVLISTKPTNFDLGTPVTWTTAEKPQWGTLGT